MKKKCSKCNIEKEIEDFNLCTRNKDGFKNQCKKCCSEYNSENYNKNRNRKILYQKEYNLKHKNKILDYFLKWKKKQRIKSTCYRLKENISHTINHILKNRNSSKLGYSIFDFLPYTIQQLKEHFESLWEPWMDWNNYGKYDSRYDPNDETTFQYRTWQIDHIIAQSKLPYDSMEHENFKKCWSLENLRPLLSIDNILKGNK